MVLPAHAGMILVDMTGGLDPVCAPRACGDDPRAFAPSSKVHACSPRMRG